MRETAHIVQAFFQAAAQVPGLAKVEFITHFDPEVWRQANRLPLLLISPHLMYLSHTRHRQVGNQLLLNTLLLSGSRRGDRQYHAALETMELLDAIDRAVLHQTWGLLIQPVELYHRRTRPMAQGLSMIQTIYYTVVYRELAASRFSYYDANNMLQSVEFYHIPTLGQSETIADLNDYERMLDGSLRSYIRPPKKMVELRLVLISTQLKDQLLSMKNLNTEIHYYRDTQTDLSMRCLWVNDFDFTEEKPGYWTGRIILQEQ
jgi:hypothetical protein